MKILHVNKFFYLKGGSEAYLFSLIDELRERGHSVAEFAMKDPLNWPTKWSKYFVHPIDYDTLDLRHKIDSASKIIYSFEAKKKIARLLDVFKPDIVHLHIFQHQLSPSILPEIKRNGIPIVYTAHDLKSVCPNYKMLTRGQVCERCAMHRYYNCLRFKCTKKSYVKSLVNTVEMYFHLVWRYYDLIDLIITPSAFYRKKLVELRFPEKKVVHIPNFVDEVKYIPKYAHDGYFVYLGRLAQEKGILTLLEAMRRVGFAELFIVGAGPLADTIQKTIATSNLANVRMTGFQTGEALRSLVLKSMFSVLPSEWYENGPMSLIESFAYGKPVVGSNIGGIPEHISDGEDGFVFEAGNATDLAEKINAMYEDPEKAIEMGRNARRKVEKYYSKETHVERIMDIYHNLIN